MNRLNYKRVQIPRVRERLRWLAQGPRHIATSFDGYIINGKRFHTLDIEKATQNFGVHLEAETPCKLRDERQVIEKYSYYGVIRKILMLDFRYFVEPVFLCDWANVSFGIRKEDGFILVNLHDGLWQFKNDPFILASQAKQVFYSKESPTSHWYVVLKAPSRGFHDLEAFDESMYASHSPLDMSSIDVCNVDVDESHVREDCEGVLV
ncbi:hypothetical protein Sjap_022986 [Stephania japonica]|uniref:DUF4216 domain-containing protein n=1 Tax=Stephania japonica TaxID=461633 RepID=A0AAP0EQD3_9MAGN